ncbi:MAG: metal ABC transporter permease [Pseudomonadota bacterium]
MDWLLPFQFSFMQNAFWIAGMVAVPTALLSCFLVTKGWALMGDAISHAVLPGVVVAYILNIPLLIGAFGAGMICAVATGYFSGNSRVKQDTIMGVVFSGMFAFGIVLYVGINTNVHLDHILFGNILGISPSDLWTAAGIALLVTLGIVLKWKDLLLHAFDPAQARVVGLPVGWLQYGLLAALSLTVVATLSATGLILAIGLLIAPGAIAFLITPQFKRMLVISVSVNIIAMMAGIYASFWIDSAPAPTIVLILTIIFIAAFVLRHMINRRKTLQV